jgi:type I restriction enzyme S subunit
VNVKKLEEVCDFISGLWTGKNPPYVSVGVIRNTNFHKSGILDFSDIAQIEVEVKQFSSRQLKFGDIVLEKSGGGPKQPVGRVCVFEKEDGLYSLSNFTSAIRVKNQNELDYKYLHYYLKHLYIAGETEKIQTNSTGIRNLQLSLYKDFLVPIPSLATQLVIVTKLDAIFAEIDKSTAAAEANAKNAEAFWQSMIDKVITDFNHLNNKASFSEVVEIKSKLVDPKEDKFQDFLHIGAGNMVSNNGELLDLKTAKEENLISGKFIFDENTVLYSKIRPYLKKVSQPSFVGLCSADVYPLVGIKNKVTKDFLFFLLLSNDFTNYAIAGSDRAGMPKVNREHLFAYQFNLPAIESQNFLTKKIKNSYVYIKVVNKALKKKILELSLLKQSILKQAFNSKLVLE